MSSVYRRRGLTDSGKYGQATLVGGWLSEVFGDTDVGRWDGCTQIWTRIQGVGEKVM